MRDEVKAFKRERIVDECSRLFRERGYQGTTVDLIAQRLHVTKPFIYAHFENKRALLVAVYERGLHRMIEIVDQILAEPIPPAERLRAFAIAFARENIEVQAISAIFLTEEQHIAPEKRDDFRKRQRDFDRRIAALIAEGVSQGAFSVADPMVAALAIIGMVRWTHRWFRTDGRLTADEMCAQMADLALNLVRFRKDGDAGPVTPSSRHRHREPAR